MYLRPLEISGLLRPKDIETIFYGISQIHDIHSNLLVDLLEGEKKGATGMSWFPYRAIFFELIFDIETQQAELRLPSLPCCSDSSRFWRFTLNTSIITMTRTGGCTNLFKKRKSLLPSSRYAAFPILSFLHFSRSTFSRNVKLNPNASRWTWHPTWSRYLHPFSLVILTYWWIISQFKGCPDTNFCCEWVFPSLHLFK